MTVVILWVLVICNILPKQEMWSIQESSDEDVFKDAVANMSVADVLKS